MPRDPRAVSKGFSPEIDHYPFEVYAREGWTLELECWGCHKVIYEPNPAGRFGPHASTGTIGRKLVCACGCGYPSMRAVILPK